MDLISSAELELVHGGHGDPEANAEAAQRMIAQGAPGGGGGLNLGDQWRVLRSESPTRHTTWGSAVGTILQIAAYGGLIGGAARGALARAGSRFAKAGRGFVGGSLIGGAIGALDASGA